MANSKAVLDRPILILSGPDHLTFRDLIEGGTLVIGGIGAGKTSGTCKPTRSSVKGGERGLPKKSSRRKNARSV